MEKNILASFASHIVVGIICYITCMILFGTIINLNVSVYLQFIFGLIHLFFVGFLYYIAGKKFLYATGNKFFDFLSVWWLSILLMVFNVLVLLILNLSDLEYLCLYLNPIGLTVGFSFGALFQELFKIEPPYFVIFIAPFFPSLGLWFGMEIKRKKKESLKLAEK